MCITLLHTHSNPDSCIENPKLADGKEVCDLLVVFGGRILIWQVKDLKVGKDGFYRPRDVEKNVRQLFGAKRRLLGLGAPVLFRNQRGLEIQFDPSAVERVFLISALVGEGQELEPFIEEHRDDAVHVLGREALQLMVDELDTIARFRALFRREGEAPSEQHERNDQRRRGEPPSVLPHEWSNPRRSGECQCCVHRRRLLAGIPGASGVACP